MSSFWKGVAFWIVALLICFIGIYAYVNMDRTFGAIVVILGISTFVFGVVFAIFGAFEENRTKKSKNEDDGGNVE